MKVNKENLDKCLKEIATFHKARLDNALLEYDIHKITDGNIPESFNEQTVAINKETNLVMDTITYLRTKISLLDTLNIYIDEMSRNLVDINKATAPVPLLKTRQTELERLSEKIRKRLITLDLHEDNNEKKET